MRLFFQVIFVVSSSHALDAQLHSAALEDFSSHSRGANSLGLQHDSSSHLLLPPSSPDCWLDTLQDLYPQDVRGNGKPPLNLSVCAQLDTHHQQALTLRLAKCHLESMGRSLVTTEDGNSCDDLHHPNGVKKCLTNLSAIATTTYTVFFKDVHYICTQLLQESVTNRYYQTTHDLEQVSRLAETRLQNMLQQQEESALFWKEKEERMIHWFQEQMHAKQQQDLQQQEESSLFWKEKEERITHWFQAQMHAKQQQDLQQEEKSSLFWKDKEEHLTHWFQEQTHLSAEQALVMQELRSLADTFHTTKASIQPWTQLVDLVFLYVPIGYSMLKTLASMLGSMIIIMILTPHKQLRRTRLKLFVVVLLGGLGEMVLRWLENETGNEIRLTASERLELSDGLQKFLMSFSFACYLSGLLSSCCGWNKDPQDDERGEDNQDDHDPAGTELRRENELQERLHLQNYQQHWTAMVVHERLQQQQHERLQATLPDAGRQSYHPQPPFLMSSSTPPPTLTHSPESTVIPYAVPFATAQWNAPPSPWTPHSNIPIDPSTAAVGNINIHDTSGHNSNENVHPTETIDLPPDEFDDEEVETEDETDESRDDSVSNNRKRARPETEESVNGEVDHERDLPVPKKPRSAGQN